MRVMVVDPGVAFSPADVSNGWCRGLKAQGCEVFAFNLGDRLNFYTQSEFVRDGERRKALSDEAAFRLALNSLYAEHYLFWPDITLIVSSFFVPNEVLDRLSSRGHTIVVHLTESPYEDDQQLKRATHADLLMLNDPTNIDEFLKFNPQTFYQPHCYDPLIHFRGPGLPEIASDFAFVGTGYPSRAEFFETALKLGAFDELKVLLAGHWASLDEGSPLRDFVSHPIENCIDNTDTADVYRSTRVSANLYRRESNAEHLSDGWAMGPREVELAACGTFFITEARGENAEVLPFVPTFSGPEDFSEQLRYWLDREAQRDEITRRATAALADRTFDNAARTLMQRVESL